MLTIVDYIAISQIQLKSAIAKEAETLTHLKQLISFLFLENSIFRAKIALSYPYFCLLFDSL